MSSKRYLKGGVSALPGGKANASLSKNLAIVNKI
jgi:hypothetical protein